MDHRILENILNSLFKTYEESVPDVRRITKEMITRDIVSHEGEIINDHIAFRTLALPNLGIKSFEKIFLHHGYKRKDYYSFKIKKLNAYWYAPPKENFPRVFISELKVPELSKKAQSIIEKYTSKIKKDPVEAIDLNNATQVSKFFHTPLWEIPTLKDYQVLLKESEYAAWVIYNRYYLNHYTISVHNLKKWI